MAAMWIMWFIRRFPARESRCRFCSPEEASSGAVPVQDANRLRSANRATSPTSARTRAATTGPTPGRSIRCEPRAQDHGLELGGRLLDLGLDRDQLGQLLDGDPAAGLAGDVAGADGGQHRLGLAGGDVALCLSGKEFSQKRLEPVDGLDPAPSQRLSSVGEDPQRLELAVDLQHTQRGGADRDDRDRVRIERVGLPVVAGVEEPDPAGELGRDIDDLLTGLEQPLGQRSSHAVSAFDRPHPLRPGLRVGPHRRIAGLVGGEPTRSEQPLVVIDDLDRGRRLVGIDPDDDVFHVPLPPVLVSKWTTRWAVLRRAGQSLLEPRLVTVPDGLQTESEPHPQAGGQPRREPPAGHLDRVWPDADPAESL